MLIEFDPAIFHNLENSARLTLLLNLCYVDRRYDFFIELPEVMESALFKELSKSDRELIGEYFNRFAQESLKPDYAVSEVEAGDSFTLKEAVRFFLQPLSIILENNKNDQHFILSLAENFVKRGKKILRHYMNHSLTFVNGGGCENIENVINEKLDTFAGMPKAAQHYLRCFVIVDSDSTYPGEDLESRKKLRAFLDGLGIKHHILTKREMENYMPDEALSLIGGNNDYLEAFGRLSPIQKDYFDIEYGFEDKNFDQAEENLQILFAGVSATDIGVFRKNELQMTDYKENFPKLFRSEKVNQQNLNARVAHQKPVEVPGTSNTVNELEQILDKINELL